MADEKTKGPLRPKGPVDTSLVPKDRIEALRKKAADKIEKERLAAAEAALLDQFEREARQQGGLDEPMEEIVIDLAPHSDRIVLDSVVYFQGRSYKVRRSVADVIREAMQAGWNHQSVIDGKSENFYRQSRGQGVTPNGVVNRSEGLSNVLRA